MDRLAACYHWNDQRSFEQAFTVAKSAAISVEMIEEWSAREGMGKNELVKNGGN